jgi:ribosome-binding factor A
MRLRLVPELLFRFDETVERGAHLMDILRDIKKEEKGSGDE